MKFSEAMLRGFMQVGGKQNIGALHRIDSKGKVVAHCVIGAADAGGRYPPTSEVEFMRAWGVYPVDLNDVENLPWEHIYGMAVAAGI